MQSRCLRWDETAVFPGFCVVSVLRKGRDCCFSGVLCGLGVGDGTRLLFFWDFVRSRCRRRDETAVFLRFCAVSVLEKGRDCRCRFKCVSHLAGGGVGRWQMEMVGTGSGRRRTRSAAEGEVWDGGRQAADGEGRNGVWMVAEGRPVAGEEGRNGVWMEVVVGRRQVEKVGTGSGWRRRVG